MKSVVNKTLLFIFGLCLLAVTDALYAADAPRAFSYDIELKIPAAQRQMMEDYLDLYRWRGRERMDEGQLQRLVKLAPAQIREFLATEGFYAPVITATISGKRDKRMVKLGVELGEPVLVSAVEVKLQDGNEGAEIRSRLAKLQSDWGLPVGAVFRHANWEAAKRDALKALLIDGYPTASMVESHAMVDPQTHRVALQVILDGGPTVTLGELDIHGLSRYPASLIAHVNPILPGEPYSQDKLLKLQNILQNTPYFSNVVVSVDTSTKQVSQLPIRVEVVEVQSRKLGVGIGASTDTGPRVSLDYRDIGFRDSALRFGSTLKLDTKKQSLSNDLQFPLDAHGYRDGITAQAERTSIAGEVTQALVVGAKRTKISGRTEHVYGLNYSFVRQNVNGTGSKLSNTLSPFFAWTLRDVDNILNPGRGFLLNLQTDIASRALLSDRDFLRGYGRGVYFQPLGQRDQLILRGELGMVAARSRDGIAANYLFRTGGDQTVRGYAYQSLGVSQAGGIVGGRYLALASVEYVHSLSQEWGGAVFLDGGNAADTLGSLRPVLGYGVGGRWKSPLGPLSLDLAYGQQTQALHLHFSLGASF